MKRIISRLLKIIDTIIYWSAITLLALIIMFYSLTHPAPLMLAPVSSINEIDRLFEGLPETPSKENPLPEDATQP